MKNSGHAVAIGASIAGLVAARSLADAFDTVTLVERDVLTDDARFRRGVPQAKHLHGLLARGSEALESLFPGFGDEMEAGGAIRDDIQSGLHWYVEGHLLKPEPSGLVGIASSRSLLERTLRDRTLALHGVRLLDDTDVIEVLATPDHRRAIGVRVRPRTGGSAPRVLAAELVVDATGRGSRTPNWLAQWGYEPPVESRTTVDTTYVTRSYRREPDHLDGRPGTFSGAFAGKPRSGFLLAQEDDTFILTTAGVFGELPPVDALGALEFVESLPSEDFAHVLRTAEPVGEPVKMHYRTSVRRHYEDLRRFPDGYLVIGDAVCSFNPVYGQGMTVAALQGLLLRDLLESGRDRLAQRFFASIAEPIGVAWALAEGSDQRLSWTGARRSFRDRLFDRYTSRLYRVAAEDEVVANAFIRVLNLIDTPAGLLRPPVVARVLRPR